MRADSVSPQASGPSTTTMPTPAVAPIGTERQGRIGRREVLRPDPGAAVPAHEECLGCPVGVARLAMSMSGVPRSTSTTPGCSHGATDRDQRGAGVLHEPVGTERVRARPGDHGDVRERLGVVHEGAPPPDAQSRPLVGPERRERVPRLDPVARAPTPRRR